MRERRRYPRIDAQVEVSFSTAEAYIVEYTNNISKGGIFLKTDKLPNPNDIIELTLGFPGAEEKVTLLGRVARTVTVSNPKEDGSHLYGVGIYFLEWNTKARRLFDDYYLQLKDGSEN